MLSGKTLCFGCLRALDGVPARDAPPRALRERSSVPCHVAELVGGMLLSRRLRKPRPPNLLCCAIASTSEPLGIQHWLVRCSSWSEAGLFAGALLLICSLQQQETSQGVRSMKVLDPKPPDWMSVPACTRCMCTSNPTSWRACHQATCRPGTMIMANQLRPPDMSDI